MQGARRAAATALCGLAVGLACAPDPGERGADPASAGDSLALDTSVRPAALPEKMPLDLEVRGAPALSGRSEVFAECRVLEGADGTSRYEVATTAGEFAGSAAALGLIVGNYRGPGSYTEDVTVTLVLGREPEPPRIVAGRSGCVARVQDRLRGSFSCEPDAPGAADSLGISVPASGADTGVASSQVTAGLGLVGRGSWSCWESPVPPEPAESEAGTAPADSVF
ncbi:MAG: hypothetical protein ABR599_06940 [Gemmatimonadota bacterium]